MKNYCSIIFILLFTISYGQIEVDNEYFKKDLEYTYEDNEYSESIKFTSHENYFKRKTIIKSFCHPIIKESFGNFYRTELNDMPGKYFLTLKYQEENNKIFKLNSKQTLKEKTEKDSLNIEFNVINIFNNKPVINAEVIINNQHLYTDFNGVLKFKVPIGKHDFQIFIMEQKVSEISINEYYDHKITLIVSSENRITNELFEIIKFNQKELILKNLNNNHEVRYVNKTYHNNG